jgi:PAS domain S-box-containing protein
MIDRTAKNMLMEGRIEQDLLRETVDEQFEHAPCGYLATLPDGTIVQANQTLLQWIGGSREQLISSGRRFQDLLTLPGKIYHDTHFAPLIQMQGSVKEVAFDLVRPQREPLPVIVNSALKRDATGKPLLTRITIFDATDRRRYERELLSARRKAEQLAEAERVAREEVLRAGRVKDEFLTLVSHELRTPLNAILGWTQILQRDPALSDDQREGLSVIERNTRTQVQLVNDLLDMGRLESGKMRLDVQQVELAEIIAGALETAHPAANAKGSGCRKCWIRA